jgi:DNA-binding transcriptional ArsR family regulator
MHGSGEWPPARVVLQIKAALEASGYPALLAEAQEREGRAEALLEKLLMAAQIDGRFDWREVETHLRSLTRAEGLKTDPLSDGEWARYKRAMMDLDDEEAGR